MPHIYQTTAYARTCINRYSMGQKMSDYVPRICVCAVHGGIEQSRIFDVVPGADTGGVQGGHGPP